MSSSARERRAPAAASTSPEALHVVIVGDRALGDSLAAHSPELVVLIADRAQSLRRVLRDRGRFSAQPDVIVCASDLPDESGLELLTEIDVSIPVVILCPGDPEIEREAIARGAAAVVHAPFNPATLARVVRHLAGRAR